MIKATLLLCSLPAVLSIIVTDPPPTPSETDYKYAYNIEDPSTGDSKSQHEVRRGDVVTGAYTVVGPDGTRRTVEYTADSKHGFKAIVKEEPVELPTKYINNNSPVQQRPKYSTIIQKPDAYLIQKLPLSYDNENRDIFLFTPANEIESDIRAFEYGKYFEPATD